MAKYKAYPEYKTTGLGWLTEIPDHWEVKKLKYLGQAIIGLTYSPDDVVDEGEGTLVLRSSNVQNGKLEFLDNVYVRKSIPLHLKVKEGDILICARNGSRALIGKNAKITKDAEGMTFGAFMSIFRSRYNSYLSHVFASALFEYQSGSFLTATINQLTTSNLNSFEIPLPPQTEQDRIVNFLDHETAKIDNLIEKQQQLIELLKEKRQAVISHAVTKGLNPDVPMKDSGVEWLGEVPEHWKIKRCKNLFDFVTSGSRGWAGFYSDEGDLFFRIANLTRDSINPKLDSIQYVTPPKGSEGERSKIKGNDLLISITADLGSVCAADESISGGYVSQHVSLCRPGRLVASSRWLAYFVLSDTAKEQLQGAGYGGTKVQLSLEDIRDLFVAYPPKSEQIKIASYLDERLSELDGLDHRAHNLIELLRERRTALISAAVTGKIDVRDWVAPDTQNVEEPQEATA